MTTTAVRLFLLPGGRRRDPAIDQWMRAQPDELADIARAWFDVMRTCGDDVRELIHDDHPTACAGDAAFAYVDAFTGHVNVGFFQGVELADPDGLLEGTGKFMRHVKIKPGRPVKEAALRELIELAYANIKERVRNG